MHYYFVGDLSLPTRDLELMVTVVDTRCICCWKIGTEEDVTVHSLVG